MRVSSYPNVNCRETPRIGSKSPTVTANSPGDLIVGDVYIRISGLVAHAVVHLKLECFSAGGSIKTKTAWQMIETLEQAGKARPGTRLIESSSGNLGLALSILAAERGYRFTCVSDPNISTHVVKLMRAYGAEVIIVGERDSNGGYLSSRLSYINSRLESDPGLVWLNQYANPANALAHEHFTGSEIASAFARIDYLFIGVGTTGTLTGVSRVVRHRSPHTRVIAVDSLGSITFGTLAGPRYIPGLGTSRRPEIATEEAFNQLMLVPEADAIVICRQLAAKGLLIGGSTGTVLAAITMLNEKIPRNSCVVAISPDFGDRYLDTIYDDAWVEARFPGLLQRCHAAIESAPMFWERKE